MKQTVIIGILLGILLLTGCDNNEKEHDFVGIFTTANGIKFELRPDSTSIITFKDSMIYESSWKISKDRNNETYANIEFAGYQNYYYLKNGKLYRSIREMNLTGSWMFSAYTDKAYHWFHSGPSNHWYRSYGVGLSLRIPIFDGLDKRYKMRKATIDIENIKLAQENTRKNLQTQYLNATNDLMNSQRNFKKQKDNYLLAEDVYTVTMDRYREGIASMTEVLQDEMRMSEAQNNYISAHYNYRITNLTLLKLTGQLETLSPSIP